MRIGAKPARTDTNVSDTGTLQIEASLERAATLGDVPLSADAHLDGRSAWRDQPHPHGRRCRRSRPAEPLRSCNRNTGRRAVAGTRADRRACTARTLSPSTPSLVDVDCTATATHAFHAFDGLRCSWPVPDSKGAIIALTGSLPDLLHLEQTAQLQIGTPHLPASILSDWAHVLSTHIPADTHASGFVAASLRYPGDQPGTWDGHADFTDLVLAGSSLRETPLVIGDASIHTIPSSSRTISLVLPPVEVPLGGHDPASLDAFADSSGYTLHLAGMIALPRLLAVGAAAPQFGEGLAAVLPKDRSAGPTRFDLTAHRTFGAGQVWYETQNQPPIPQRRNSMPVPVRERRR